MRAARARLWYVGLLWAGLLWAAGNCLYVYLVLRGDRTFRIEAACYLLAGLTLPLLVFGRPRPTLAADLSRRWVAALGACATALWLALLAPLIRYPFLSDDYVFLDRFGAGDNLAAPFYFFRPAFNAVFFALAALGGGSPIPFHVAGLAVHFGCALCVFALARRVSGANGPAAVAFAAFLLNPLQLEAVLWASGLQELLWAAFVLAACLVYTRTQRLTGWRLTATLLLAAGGLASKETAVSFVLLLPALDGLLYRFNRGPLTYWAYAGFLIELAGYLAARARLTSIGSEFLIAPSRFFVKQFLAMPYKTFAQPWNLEAAVIPGWILAAAAIAPLLLIFVAVVVRRVSPLILAGPFIMLISSLPLYSYFFIGPDLAGARYLYFPAVGWGLLLGGALAAVVREPRALVTALATLIVVWGVSLNLNLRPWLTAADLVRRMTDDVARGIAPEASAAAWEAETGQALERRNGVPADVHGVGIFNNGHPEFVSRTRTR